MVIGLVASLLVTIVALKFAESRGGLDFDRSGSLLIVALTCEGGGWGTDAALAMILPADSSAASFTYALAMLLGTQLISTMALLLLAWAIVPGVHIRRFTGLVLASILIVVFRYAVTVMISRMGQ